MKYIKYFIDILKKLNGILNRKQKLRGIGILFWMLVSSVFELLGISAMVPLINSFLRPEEQMNNKYFSLIMRVMGVQSYMGLLTLMVFGIVIIYIIKNILLIYSRAVQTRFQCRIEEELSLLMLKSYLARPYFYYVQTNSSDVRYGVISDVSCVFSILQTVCQLLAESITVLFIVAYIVYTDWFMAVGITLSAGILLLVLVFCLKNVLKRNGEQFRERSMEKDQCMLQISHGIKDIFVMQRKKFFYGKFEKSCDECTKLKNVYQIISGLPERIIEMTVVAVLLFMILLKLGQGADAAAFVPQLGALVVAAYRLLPSINKFSDGINAMIFNSPSLNAAYDNICAARHVLGTELEKGDPCEGKFSYENYLSDESCLSFEKSLNIHNITWEYPSSEQKIFDNASVEIKKGESVAIIGESGAGKTTLADIILGLYPPTEGKVTADGQDIYSAPEQWAKIIAYVPQTVYLMDDTIRANVLFGCDDTDEGKIWDALEQAQLKEFVMSLPAQLDTIVGEAGVRFSGGQRQRIAIARALYSHPEILLLDEATSALDNDTETAVMEAIDSLKGKITLIIIAHRLSTIKNCGKVYEVKNGGINELTNIVM